MKIDNKLVVIFALIALVIAFAGAIVYFSNAVSFRDSEITDLHSTTDQQSTTIGNLNSQINSLNDQITNLTGQISSLHNQLAPSLVTALGISEVPSNSTYNANNPTTFNHIYISGTVTNQGANTAYNAGLHVVAYDATGTLVIDMTVPLGYGNYGSGTSTGSNVLTSLGGLGSSTCTIGIVHVGVATTWSVTPVWTASP